MTSGIGRYLKATGAYFEDVWISDEFVLVRLPVGCALEDAHHTALSLFAFMRLFYRTFDFGIVEFFAPKKMITERTVWRLNRGDYELSNLRELSGEEVSAMYEGLKPALSDDT